MIGLEAVLVITYLIIATLSIYPIIFQLIIIRKNTQVKTPVIHKDEANVSNLYIIIPAKSEPLEVLEDAMKRLSNVKPTFILDNYPRELRPLIEKMAGKYDVHVMFRDKAVGYKGGALNHVIKRLELPDGSYMVVLDVDSAISPEHMRLLARYAANFDAVVPRWIVKNGSTSQLTRGQWIGYLFFFKVINGLQRAINWVPILGSGSAVNVGSLRRVGYWPESILEDVELGIRFFINGLRTYYADDVHVYVDAPVNYWGFLTQQIRWSFGASEVLRKYISGIMKRKGGFTVALYLGQYMGYLFQLLALLLMIAITILGIELPLWAFIAVIIIYIPTFSIYLYQLVKLVLEYDDNIKSDIFAINALNMSFMMAMPKLAMASIMGLTGLGKVEWIPTPKGSVTIKHNISRLIPEFFITIIVIITLIIALIRGLWLNVLVLLPYTAVFVRGLWRILNGTL